MRKILALFIVLVAVLLVFSIGCSKDDSRKTVSSRPVAAQPVGEPSAPAEAPETLVEPMPAEEEPVPQEGLAFCEQLSGTDVAAVMGGTWSKVGDCPRRDPMPAGVSVCRCDYDGPKQMYVNVETHLYDDTNEAERVYNMYCKGTAEESEVGTYSCRVPRSNELRPNYVYFLKGNYFVKVSCLGGSCPLDAVAELAKKVDAEV
ncbi:hypothetical protein KY359_07000 [Candidatus Woesearchaeota archaeon]|nr:hypothetical protein [Candidatus Woesearchaeota archaeon]